MQHQTLFVDTRTLRHTVSPLQHYVNDKPCPESLLSPNAKCCGVSVPTYTQYANQILYRPSKIHKRTLEKAYEMTRNWCLDGQNAYNVEFVRINHQYIPTSYWENSAPCPTFLQGTYKNSRATVVTAGIHHTADHVPPLHRKHSASLDLQHAPYGF